MATTEKTVSALVNRQLPDFVRSDHPQFKRFLELYYEWLEDESKGNTVYHIMRSGEYRDVDTTLDPFIRLFKQELLPYFPERSELDLVKVLKGAREFYVKKGSEESVKWLFRVLYGQDIQIYLPKKQILIASDGKWKLPQAFQLTLSANNASIDPNLLEKHKGTGTVSKATAIIESANRTVDRTFGNEILELYVSNVTRSFQSGENLEIPYTDDAGIEQLFVEKIIGSISGIRVDAPQGDATSPRRGLLYNVGDPVIVFGGLASTAEANDAVGVVGNVTQGSVESLTIAFPGYGYRTYTNTEATVYRSVGDDPNANLSTDIRVAGISTANSSANTNERFLEYIVVDKMPIDYLSSQVLSNTGDWVLFSSNNRNMSVTLNGTPGSGSDKWHQYEDWYADSDGSYETANIVGKIITSNAAWTGAAATVTLYAVQNTAARPLTLLVGNLISTVNSSKNFTIDAILDDEMAINANSAICQALNFERIETGGVTLYNVINGGYGFRTVPTVGTESYHDTYLSEGYAYGTPEYANSRQRMDATGQISHVYISNPGDGYANGDTIVVSGSGYGFTGYVNVGAGGAIVKTTIINRGEGFYGSISANVTTSGGANATLTPYGFGKGVSVVVANSAIGRVRDIRLVSRGFDYVTTPNVSLKIVDMVIDGIGDLQNLPEGERVFQGATLETAVFQGIIKDYNRSTKALRLYNFSGNSFTNFNSTLEFTSEGGVKFNVNTAAVVAAPSDYPPSVIASGLTNPHFYGNGKAKGVADFFNGLIKFTGFYLNSDGFLSSDKKLQDSAIYHNYSYIIESERSLAEYENTMKDIVHPIGMVMLSRTISKSELMEVVRNELSVAVANAVSGTVAVANSYNTKVTGTGTNFTANAAVGDMIVVTDGTHPLRSFAKVITTIDSTTVMNVESNFLYVGQGRVTTNAGNNEVVISGNSNVIGDFLKTGDTIRFNVGNTAANIETYQITVGSGTTLTLNNNANTSNTELVYHVVPDYTAAVAHTIIKVSV
jgi:hypothetical protein